MKAYKGFKRHDDGTLWCQDFQYKPGKIYKHKGKVEICESGFHACHEPYQVWSFYPNNGNNVFWEVECGGKIIESEENDGKFVCSEIRLVKEIDMTDVAKFDYAYAFSEGFAVIKFNGKCNFIDTSGKLLSGQWYDDVIMFHDGFAPVEMEDGKWNLIDTNGDILFEEWKYKYIGIFTDGFAQVKREDDKWNYINIKGDLLSEEWFDKAYNFSGGLGIVEKDNEEHFINKNGKLLFPKYYKTANCIGHFHDGYAKVIRRSLDKKINFIDMEGNLFYKIWRKNQKHPSDRSSFKRMFDFLFKRTNKQNL